MLKFASILLSGMVLAAAASAPSMAAAGKTSSFKPNPNCEYAKIGKGRKIAAAQYCSGKDMPAELSVVRKDGTVVVFKGVPSADFTGLTKAASPDAYYKKNLQGHYQTASNAKPVTVPDMPDDAQDMDDDMDMQ
jgi:hypothetical protein